MQKPEPLATLPRDEDTFKLQPYAWPGGYQIVYYCPNGDALCVDCAQKAYNNYANHVLELFCLWCAGEDEDGTCGWFGDGDIYRYNYDDMPHMANIHYEGPSEFCADCNKELPSEYGDPDNPEDD